YYSECHLSGMGGYGDGDRRDNGNLVAHWSLTGRFQEGCVISRSVGPILRSGRSRGSRSLYRVGCGEKHDRAGAQSLWRSNDCLAPRKKGVVCTRLYLLLQASAFMTKQSL